MQQAQVHYVEHPDATIDIGPHVFPTEKYGILPHLLRSELGIPDERFHAADTLAEDDLARVHTAPYISDLHHARTTPATAGSELPVTHPVIQAFLTMAGGSITAVQLARAYGIGFHLGGGFHHAFADHAEGFCYVNDVAVAIERSRADRSLGQVLIVDVDVHQGNGTAAIYANDASTFTYSIHQEHNYPVKQHSDLDRGLEDGVGDDEYLRILASDLDTIETRCNPQLACYLAGVDPYEHDQLGGLKLTLEGLERRDRYVFDRFLQRDIPVAVLLAGGYAPTPQATAGLHIGTARAAETACVASRAGT
jgi:acetoin utilization deacetylase AcuC-like enzyme